MAIQRGSVTYCESTTMNIWTDANGWPIPPIILLGCLVTEILYVRGWRVLVATKEDEQKVARAAHALATSGSASSGAHKSNSWFWRGILFLCAIFTFLVATSAPIDILSGRFFWVHMVQHLLLLVVMAPLLVASAPLLPLWLGLPGWTRRILQRAATPDIRRVFSQAEHWLRNPAISCIVLIIGTWVWHWPPLYDLAMTNDIIHDWCEHLTFMVVSLLFWTQVIASPPLKQRAGYFGRLGCVGVAIAQNLVLAVLLGFAPGPLYAPYAHMALSVGGFTVMQDQQFGAGIMWTFGDVPFGIAFSILIQQWLGSESDETTSTASFSTER